MAQKLNRAKALRVERNYTQQEAADVIGITKTAYQNKEAGRTRWYFDEIVALADFYKVDITAFEQEEK